MEEDAQENQDTLLPRIYVERTLAMIKPDAVGKADEIEEIILQSGFTILQVTMNNLDQHSSSHHDDNCSMQNKYRM